MSAETMAIPPVKSTGAVSTDDVSEAHIGSEAPWYQLTNAQSSNNSYATTALFDPTSIHSGTLTCLFGQLAALVPEKATIVGVEVTREWRVAPGYTTNLSLETQKLWYDVATIGSDRKSTPGQVPTVEGVSTYGGSGDTWGATLTAEIVRDASFGAVLQLQLAETGAYQQATCLLDHVTMTVYYYTQPRRYRSRRMRRNAGRGFRWN